VRYTWVSTSRGTVGLILAPLQGRTAPTKGPDFTAFPVRGGLDGKEIRLLGTWTSANSWPVASAMPDFESDIAQNLRLPQLSKATTMARDAVSHSISSSDFKIRTTLIRLNSYTAAGWRTYLGIFATDPWS